MKFLSPGGGFLKMSLFPVVFLDHQIPSLPPCTGSRFWDDLAVMLQSG